MASFPFEPVSVEVRSNPVSKSGLDLWRAPKSCSPQRCSGAPASRWPSRRSHGLVKMRVDSLAASMRPTPWAPSPARSASACFWSPAWAVSTPAGPRCSVGGLRSAPARNGRSRAAIDCARSAWATPWRCHRRGWSAGRHRPHRRRAPARSAGRARRLRTVCPDVGRPFRDHLHGRRAERVVAVSRTSPACQRTTTREGPGIQ